MRSTSQPTRQLPFSGGELRLRGDGRYAILLRDEGRGLTWRNREELEMPTPSITELNVGKLCAFLDRTWDLRKEMRKSLEQKVPALQGRAKATNTIPLE